MEPGAARSLKSRSQVIYRKDRLWGLSSCFGIRHSSMGDVGWALVLMSSHLRNDLSTALRL